MSNAALEKSPLDTIPSEEEVLERARNLIPMLRAKAAETEENRVVPKEIIAAFLDAGFYDILKPKFVGGWEMHPRVFYKVLMEIGRGCGSSAWVLMVTGIHNWEFGLLPERAAVDVWKDDGATIVGSSYAAAGRAERVEGGYKLNGVWPTSSGCDHCDYSFLGGMVPREDSAGLDLRAFLVGRENYEIIDDWQVFGLNGTGSKSLKVTDAFVPDHHHHSLVDYRLSDRSDIYLMPWDMAFYFAVSSVLVGFGQAAVDYFIEEIEQRKRATAGTAIDPVTNFLKIRLAEAQLKVRSAKTRLLHDMDEAYTFMSRRELVPTEARTQYWLDSATVGRDIQDAVMLLFQGLSARGVFLRSPLQRVLRDVIVASNHITQNSDATNLEVGSLMLGGPLPFKFGGQ